VPLGTAAWLLPQQVQQGLTLLNWVA
jgi:hypothetical protein